MDVMKIPVIATQYERTDIFIVIIFSADELKNFALIINMPLNQSLNKSKVFDFLKKKVESFSFFHVVTALATSIKTAYEYYVSVMSW